MKRQYIKYSLILLLIIVVFLAVAFTFYANKQETDEQVIDSVDKANETVQPNEDTKPPETKVINTLDIDGAHSSYDFTAEIPSGWLAQSVPATEAINFYDPAVQGEDSLEKSQIFIRHFSADDFLTLQTVDILSREELTINNQPAVRYEIEKKPNAKEFPNQPKWRNQKHIVTDVRVSSSNPSIFYVVAKNPNLSNDIYENVLSSIKMSSNKEVTLMEPIKEFKKRITKKPFGIYITPQDSPVHPEKFSGYHAGVDVEYTDINEETSVYSIADGEIIAGRTATGYGGVIAIKHTVNNQNIIAIYGHLDPGSMTKKDKVLAGEKIAILGDDKSSETDGERKHLHFAMLKGVTLDLKGYVSSRSELANWHNPLDFY